MINVIDIYCDGCNAEAGEPCRIWCLATRDMNATCGHDDILGYLTNNPCVKCAKANHAKAMGKGKG